MLNEKIENWEALPMLPAGTVFEDQASMIWALDEEKTMVYDPSPHCIDCGDEIKIEGNSTVYLFLEEDSEFQTQVHVTFESYFKTKMPCRIISVPYEIYRKDVRNAESN